MPKLTYVANRVKIETPFSQPFVDAIKATIPSGYRNYNPHDRSWIVYQPYVGEARRLVKTYFSGVEEDGIGEFEQGEARRRAEEQARQEESARRQREYSREGFGYTYGHGRQNTYNSRQSSQDGSGREQSTNATQDTLDPYQILYVTAQSPKEVVFAAYKALALRYHPDRNRDADATDKMQRINAAFDAIKSSKGWT